MTMIGDVGVSLDIVTLRNPDDAPTFHMKYGPTKFLHIEPGQSVTVPEEVAWHFLGRWWTDNSDPRERARTNEYRRLRQLYGAYDDEVLWEEGYPSGHPSEPHATYPRGMKPRIEAYTMLGERITTVIDDPDGNANMSTQVGREMSLERQVAFLGEQLAKMQRQLDTERAQSPQEGHVAFPDENPNPAPPTFPQPPANLPGNVQVPMAPPPVTVDGTVEAGALEDAAAPDRLAVTPEPVVLSDEPPSVDAPRRGGKVGAKK